jgi:hypothetical protein
VQLWKSIIARCFDYVYMKLIWRNIAKSGVHHANDMPYATNLQRNLAYKEAGLYTAAKGLLDGSKYPVKPLNVSRLCEANDTV